MLRLDFTRLQGVLAVFLLACLFSASAGGVTADSTLQSISAPNDSIAANVLKPTKTPHAKKTRKNKKTPTPTETTTVEPTPTATESAAPTETALATKRAPAPKRTARAAKTKRARKTRRAEKTQTAAPTPTTTPIVSKRDQSVQVTMQSAKGGRLVAQDGRLVVTVPPRALPVDARLEYKPTRKDKHRRDLNGRVVINRFSLRAYSIRGTGQTPQAITQFYDDLTISIQYDPAWLGSWQEDNLQILYWDETLEHWEPLLTSVDEANNVVSAETDHFTDYGLADAPDVQNYLPSIEGFQTDLFSGAAGYSFPIQVPAGQGGLTPRLSLSYSSTGIDGFNSTGTASYVGVGWSIDTSYIARDTHNTISTADDTFSLVLNGAGYDLVKDGNGKWHTNKEQFWKITRANGGIWTILTNDGTTYLFGSTAASRGVEWRQQGVSQWFTDTYQYWLDTVTDTHGNQIEYTYDHQTDTCLQGTSDTAIYPKKIVYNSDGAGAYRTRILFNYSTRSDYNVYYSANSCAPEPYNKSKLDRIEVKSHDPNNAMLLVRAYEFTYDYSLFTGVYNDHHNGTGAYGKLALKEITTKGSDDTSTLPPYTFTYNYGRLNVATNSIGGKVDFDYEKVTAGQTADEYNQDYTTWTCGGSVCTIPAYAFWSKIGGSGLTFDVRQDPLNKWSLAYQISTSSIGNYLKWKVSPFNPGASYTFTQTLSAGVSGIQAQIRLYDQATGSETTLAGWTTLTANAVTNMVATFTLDHAVKNPELRFYAKSASGNPTVYIRRTLLQPLSTHNRVITKTVKDGMGNSNAWSYSYVGIATNDAAHSDAAQSPKPRHPMYSEFRGHSQVTVTDPLGNKTVNDFAQDNLYAGKALTVTQKNSGNAKYGVTQNQYGSDNFYSNSTTGESIDFVKLKQTTVQTFDGQATAVGKLTKFHYDSYGNITQTLEYSDTTTATLYRTTNREFYSNTTQNITNKVARVYVLNGTGAKVSETQNIYDNNTAYNQPPGTKGELRSTRVYWDATHWFTSTTYMYDAWGNVTDVTDANSNTTHTDYDAQYHVYAEHVTSPFVNADLTTDNVYDVRMGLLTSTTDPNNATTSTGYDVFGRRAWVKAPGEQGYAATAQYTYTLSTSNPSKVEVRVRNDLGGSNAPTYQYAWYFYDGLGRLIQKQGQAENPGQIVVVNTAYDARGNVSKVSLPYLVFASGGTYQTPSWTANTFTLYTYDPIGRVTRVTNPDGTYTENTYDRWLTTMRTPNGTFGEMKKDFLADAMGRTTRVREYENGGLYATTTYGYDHADRLVDTWDAAGNNTHLTYDWLGRKLTMQDPDMGNWSYGYDNNGNLKRQTDARGNSVCFDYDALNRQTAKTARTNTANCTGGTVAYNVTYGYDSTANGNKGLGRRTSMSDPTGSTSWTYNVEGELTKTSVSITGAPSSVYETSFTYDAMGRVVTTTYPDNEVVTGTYNNQGIEAVNSNYSNFITASTYTASSQLDTLTFGNGAVTDYTYHAQNLRLTDIVTTKSGTTLLDIDYTFDNVGNILTAKHNVGGGGLTTYTYDDLNRLMSATATLSNTYTRSWTYNTIGNIATRNDGGGNLTYTYDPAHKHAVKQVGTNYFCYDNNGNMTRRNSNSSCTSGDSMSYDVENRMTQMIVGATTTNLAYNGDGVRVKREVVGVGTTYYLMRHHTYCFTSRAVCDDASRQSLRNLQTERRQCDL